MRQVPKGKWTDPVKNMPPREETLNVKGDFKEFTELMRRIINKREKAKPSSSRAPAAS